MSSKLLSEVTKGKYTSSKIKKKERSEKLKKASSDYVKKFKK